MATTQIPEKPYDAGAGGRWVEYVLTVLMEVALTASVSVTAIFTSTQRFPTPYVLMIVAIVYLFGRGPAILAFCLGLSAYDYSFIEPLHRLWPIATTAREWDVWIEFFFITAIAGICGVWMHETRKRIQSLAEDLDESNQRLNSTLESIADAFFAVDRDWRFTYTNKEAERLIGRPSDELIGSILWEKFPDESGVTLEALNKAMSEGGHG